MIVVNVVTLNVRLLEAHLEWIRRIVRRLTGAEKVQVLQNSLDVMPHILLVCGPMVSEKLTDWWFQQENNSVKKKAFTILLDHPNSTVLQDSFGFHLYIRSTSNENNSIAIPFWRREVEQRSFDADTSLEELIQIVPKKFQSALSEKDRIMDSLYDTQPFETTKSWDKAREQFREFQTMIVPQWKLFKRVQMLKKLKQSAREIFKDGVLSIPMEKMIVELAHELYLLDKTPEHTIAFKEAIKREMSIDQMCEAIVSGKIMCG